MPVKNLTEISELFGVSMPTVRAWVRRDCPYLQKGSQHKSWESDSVAVFEWHREQAALAAVGDVSKLDVDEARRRKLAAEAALSELELSKARGDVVSIEETARFWLDIVAAVRSPLLALPAKVAPLVAPQADLATIRTLLQEQIEEALTELSRYDAGVI